MSLTVERLVELGRVTAFDRSPDGSWLAVEVQRADDEAARYRSELWRVPTEGEPERLFVGTFDDGAPRFRQDGALGFLSNRTSAEHGSEDVSDDDTHKQVWLLKEGRIEALTDAPLGVTAFRFARHADRLVCVCPLLPEVPFEAQRETAADRKKRGPSIVRYSEMPARHWDHWLGPAEPHFVAFDAQGGSRVDLTPRPGPRYRDAMWDLSDDGRILAATSQRPSDLRIPLDVLDIISIDDGSCRELGAATGLSHECPQISPDGTRVAAMCAAITREDGLGPDRIQIFDLVGDGHRFVADGWDRSGAPCGWLDEDRLLVTAHDQGDVPVFCVDLRSEAVERLTADASSHRAVSVHGDRILAIRDALLAPPEVVALEPGAPSARPLTSLSGITPEALAQRAVVESHRVQSTDGTEVPYYLVRPAQAPGPMPLLLWIHGGPMSQWGQTWHWRWNALVAVSHGMAVALPNPRGSTGLGHDYKHQIWHNNWGGQCYRDLMCVTDALVARPDIDADRTCAMGGSFGGYMTNWIGGQTDRFRCLVTHASIFDFTQFGLTTDLPAWWALSIGDPWADPEAMGRYSPVRHAPDWTTPVLILHGEKDYRCPIGESLALFEALRRHDVDAELCVFPDENHWILKPRNVVAWYTTVFEFLHRKMR